MNRFKIDIWLIIAVLGLSVIGIFFIYSTGQTALASDNAPLVNNLFSESGRSFLKQSFFIIIATILLIIFALFSYRKLGQHIYIFYFFGLVILLLTALFGREVNGARSWIGVGPFGVQPSEFMKLIVIFTLAKYVELRGRDFKDLRDLLVPFAIVGAPVLLIIIQPDLGTSLIFLPILFSILLVGGAKLEHIFYIFLIGAVAVTIPMFITYYTLSEIVDYHGVMRHVVQFLQQKHIIVLYGLYLFLAGVAVYIIHYFFKLRAARFISYTFFSLTAGLGLSLILQIVLKEYQKRRLLVFLDPELDPFDSGYQIIQSVIAIGSGGLTGYGFLKGPQNRLGFLPEESNDFIFSVICEELGFFGGIMVLILFGVLIFRGLRITMVARDLFGSLVAVGFTSTILFHVLVNIGVTLGIMPLTGVPLVFISTGGSSLLVNYIGIGILLNIYANRYYN
jgi:rod shape determining protein RodA